MKRSEEDVQCRVENLEHRLKKIKLRWFGHVTHRDENGIFGEGWSWKWKIEGQ